LVWIRYFINRKFLSIKLNELMQKKKTQQKKKASSKAVARNVARPTKSVPRAPSVSGDVARHTRTVCSISDPFCDHANGAKFVGSTTARTLPWRFHTRFTLSSDTNGYAAHIFTPGYAAFGSDGTVAAGVATFGSNPAISTPSCQDYRIVSWGVKIRKIVAPLSASGMVRIRIYPATGGSALGVVTYANYNCSQSEDIPVSNANEVVIVGQRLDYTHARMRTPATTNPGGLVTDWVAPGWAAVIVGIDGAPASTPILDLELFANFEVSFNDSDSLSLLTTPPLPVDPVSVNVSDNIYNAGRAIFTAGAQQASKYIENKAVQLLQSMATNVFSGRMAALALVP
jgi:hypothetical protein